MVTKTMLLHERRFRERPCFWPIVSRSATLATVAMAAAVPTFSWTYKAGRQQLPHAHAHALTSGLQLQLLPGSSGCRVRPAVI